MQRYRLPLTREVPIPSDEEAQLPQPIAYYYLASEVDARIAALEKALQEIIRTAATIPGDAVGGKMHPFAAQYLVSARAVDAARSLMESKA
jgi:hypothetical protein